MTDLVNQLQVLEIPRGDLSLPPLQLDMVKLYDAESRISETRTVNAATASELMSVFNEACNTGNKYIAWIKYEILISKKNFDLAKATVIIDRLPDEVAKLKAAGVKDNADFRSALVDRDPDCRAAKDSLDTLEAVKTFIEAKIKSFERSYWDSKENGKRLSEANHPSLSLQLGSVSATPQTLDVLQLEPVSSSFIGKSKF